jgi:hypothetical protein
LRSWGIFNEVVDIPESQSYIQPMVERNAARLDSVFHASAMPHAGNAARAGARRQTTGELAEPSDISLAAAVEAHQGARERRADRREVRGRTHLLVVSNPGRCQRP